MRSVTLALIAMLGVALAPIVSAQGGPAEPKPAEAKPAAGVKWLNNFEEAKKAATAAKKGLFIEFTAEW